MIDQARLSDALVQFKKDLPAWHWQPEKYKWIAVKWFQDHWDIDAADFAGMLENVLSKTGYLLASRNNFPKGMITEFAQTAPEEVRAMFRDLYDESREVYERISAFKQRSAAMLEKYRSDAANHYQNENAISVYLWLRYPDRHYVYKFREVKNTAEELRFDYRFKQGAFAGNIGNFYGLYDEINRELKKDRELLELFRGLLTPDCYPDPELKTLAADVAFYISRFYIPKRKAQEEAEQDMLGNDPSLSADAWFPPQEVYTPGLTVDQWLDLLRNKGLIGPNWGGALAAFYEAREGAACTQIARHFGKTASAVASHCTQLAMAIHKATECPLFIDENGKPRYWPILFLGRTAGAEVPGGYVWKLRPELYDALTQFDILRFRWPEAENAPADTGTTTEIQEESPLHELKKPALDPYTRDDFLNEVYMDGNAFDALAGLLKNKKNVILQGAPGVGKTFTARRLAWALMGEKDDSRVELVQFHQSYSYEDFVMGYKPAGDGFELKYGVFYRFCQRAANHPGRDHYFIIDEINRGNLSKIFGELLMLIEKDYRGTSAALAYSGMPFSVPENLCIIGMMNTADRSLAMIDYALRRRFSFFGMKPGFDSEGFRRYQEGLNSEPFNRLVDTVKRLNDAIAADKTLGSGFCIGHSYFCGCTACTGEWLSAIVEYDLLPMLGEYWFDDPDKLAIWENHLREALR